MATVENWVETLSAGDTAIYPFVGTEWIWLLIAIIFWLLWHFRTSASESEEHNELASKGKSSTDYKNNIADW